MACVIMRRRCESDLLMRLVRSGCVGAWGTIIPCQKGKWNDRRLLPQLSSERLDKKERKMSQGGKPTPEQIVRLLRTIEKTIMRGQTTWGAKTRCGTGEIF